MALISSSRRFLVLTALACLAGNHYAGAFAPSKPVFQTSTRLPVSLQEAVTDVSIEYDSAAKLAYSEWREKYSKGDFDAARYESFKANYEALTIANVVAAKKARDEKSETPPRRLDLNEFADMTAEEYMAMQSGETVEAPKVEETEESDESQKVDLLSAAFESTVSQSEAASAIEEAATALAEEEKKLAEKLGLESVEELEVALDSMAGVAEDGGELDPTNLSREARIRAAYLDWCKEYGKEPDEERFPTFSSNFLVMESYAQENGKDMQLNKYADCTEEEYVALTTGAEVTVEEVEEPAVEEEEVVEAQAEEEEEVVEEVVDSVAEEEAAAAAEAAEKAEAEAKAAAEKAEAEAKAAVEKAKAAAEKKKQEEEAAKKAARLPKVGTVPIKQAPPAKVEKIDLEAEAIAKAKAIAEAEAEQVAKRQAIDEAAAEKVRKEAEEWRQKAAQLPDNTLATEEPEPEPVPEKKSLFSFIPKPAQKPKAVAPPKKAAPAPKKAAPKKKVVADGKKPSGIIGNFFSSPAKKAAPAPKKVVPAPAPKVVPAPVPAPAPVAAKESKPFFGGLLEKKASAPAKKAPVAAKKAPAPVKKAPVAPKTAAVKTDDPVTDAFASFFGSSKSPAPAPKKVAPTPAPAPAPKAATKPASSFSFFASKPATPKPAPKVAPTPAPKPVAKPFAMFGSKPAAPKPAPKAEPTPAPKPATQTFSLFGSSPKPAPKVEPAPAPAPTPSPKPFSFFGSSPAPKPAPKVEPTPAPTPAPKPFSFFGSTPKPAPKVEPTPAPKPAAKKTASFFGTSKAKTPAATIKISSAKKPVKRSMGGTINLKAAAKKQSPAATKVVKKKTSGTFALFGKPAQSVQKQAAVKSAPAKKAAPIKPKPGIPVLKNWSQNKDGSISGKVSNSKNFRNGERITTSPVRGKVEVGAIVITASGSKYQLM